MTPERAALLVTTLTVVLVAVGSGPLVPGVDLTSEGDVPNTLYHGFAADRAAISVEKRLSYAPESLPEHGTLERVGREYRVVVPDAALTVETGDAPVTVGYAVHVPALSYSRRASVEVPAGSGRRVVLELPEGTLPTEAVAAGRDRYDATLVVSVTLAKGGDADWRTFTVARGNATLEVVR